MKGYLLISTLSLLSLAGCTSNSIPKASSFPIVAQREMVSARNWDCLAQDVARRLKKTIDISFPYSVVKPSVFIKANYSQDKTEFDQAFFKMLTIKLIQQGLVVLHNRTGNYLDLDYDMQVVQHSKFHTEVVFTSFVKQRQQYVFGDSRVYYIDDGDFEHYDKLNKITTYKLVNY